MEPEVSGFIGTNADLRRRVFAVTNVSTPENAGLVLRYNRAYPSAPVTLADAPQPSYDAFYALAYATYALGDGAVTGPALAKALARLVPPGQPIEVGPSGIFEAFATLRAGSPIDLRGAMGALDFDPATGEAPVDYAILCCGRDERGRASGFIESGLVFDSARGVVTGAMHCP